MDPFELWGLCHPVSSKAAEHALHMADMGVARPPSNQTRVLPSRVTCSQAPAGEQEWAAG